MTPVRVSSAFAPAKRSKYGAVKTRFGEEVFDSRKECERWIALRRLQQAGEISDLERQVSYVLTVAGVKVGAIRPDFRYRRNGQLVVEDVKSKPTMTPLFKWKAKHLAAEHGVTLEIYQ